MHKRELQRIIGDYLFLSPQLILYVGLTILPFIIAIPVLFTDRANFSDPEVNSVGLSNFTRILEDDTVKDVYWPALMRTVRFTLLNYIMVYAFGLTLALLMFEFGMKTGFFTIIFLPWMISGLALGYIATMLLSPNTGTLNLLLLEYGILEKPINIKLPSGTTVILPILVGWKAAGFNMAIFLSGMLGIPTETIEASIVDGATYWQRLFRIYFPQMIPSFVIATIFCLLGSFNLFDELVALGGLYENPEARFLSIVFFQYGFQMDRLALGMTLAVETGVPLVVLGMMLQRLQRRFDY
ncbi:MAG: sugar ABC transporter permease [Chloroflexi bacterium]|nr:sugar ABC transporter permease [Chloroflexota bacterium]